MRGIELFKQFIKRWKSKRVTAKVAKTAKQCGKNLRLNGKSNINNNTILGNNVNFNGMTIIGNGEVVIGDNFHSGEGCYIITQNHDYDFGETIPYSNTHSIEKPVRIGDNVWLGVGVIVLPGVTIEEGVIIQAGSVVVNNIPKYAIAGGHPAEVFKYRNKEHYEDLKRKKKFF